MSNGNGAPESAKRGRVRMLSDAIRDARIAAGLTQAQLGGIIGTPQSVVSTWENGSIPLRVETVHAIEVALGVYPGGLLVAGGYVRLAVEGEAADTHGWYFG